MSRIPVTERPFSDLLPRPSDVTDDVGISEGLLRRRDGADLRLTRVDNEAQSGGTFAAIGRLPRHRGLHNAGVLGDALGDALPWLVQGGG